jgi:hypothetical protein
MHRHTVVTYFVAAFSLSWLAALLVAAPALMRGETIPQMSGLLMFPAIPGI